MDTSTTRTVTGILEWPTRPRDGSEGRIRQAGGLEVVLASDADPVVPPSFADRLPLRSGLRVTVEISDRPARTPPARGRQGRHRNRPEPPHAANRAVVERFLEIEGMAPDAYRARPPFDELTVIDPTPRLTLEHPGCAPSCRLIDMFCPVGRGQRGLIVSPPKAGKTTLLKDITSAVLRNHPEVHVIIMLIDERPEEVTDFRRSFTRPAARPGPDGAEPAWDRPWAPERVTVVASSNDHDTERHIRTATMAIERAKRMVEGGHHVMIVVDSLTRLSRAFNRSDRHASSGRTLSGGIDSRALEVPKQIFGAARNTEEAGSLTIIATCLVDTGSQGDQVIFEEFKGTGNMELILDRSISERRLFPAIDLAASGTRKEDLLLDEKACRTIGALRRRMSNMQPHQQVEQLLSALKRFETNDALLGSAGGG